MKYFISDNVLFNILEDISRRIDVLDKLLLSPGSILFFGSNYGSPQLTNPLLINSEQIRLELPNNGWLLCDTGVRFVSFTEWRLTNFVPIDQYPRLYEAVGKGIYPPYDGSSILYADNNEGLFALPAWRASRSIGMLGSNNWYNGFNIHAIVKT